MVDGEGMCGAGALFTVDPGCARGVPARLETSSGSRQLSVQPLVA